MSEKVTFLKAESFRVIDEVIALMDPNNPVTACGDLPDMIIEMADNLEATLKTDPWRQVTGSSGGLYPIYVSDSEPYVVYAVAKRPNGAHMYVMHVGLRNGLRTAMFFKALSAEIDQRLALKGWLP
jgi:hypothetical protein